MQKLRSLRARLVLWTVALEAVLLLILAAVMLFAVYRLQQRQVNETLRLGVTQLNAVIDVQGGQYLTEAADIAALRREGVIAWVLTPEGQVVKTVGDADEMAVPTTLPDFGEFGDITLPGDIDARVLVAHLQEGGANLGTLVLALPLQRNQLFGRLIWGGLALTIPIVLLLSAAGGYFLAGRALAPIRTITRTARRISADDLSQRLQLDLPDDEIGRLARTFNAMLARLDQAFRRERQLTADVSHELRTPLAMLKTQLSLARSRPRDLQTLQDMMAEMEGDVDRMTRLIEQMLTLSALEQGQPLAATAIELTPLLTRVVEQLTPAAAANGVSLHLTLPTAPLPLLADSDGLGQVLTNLLQNAIKYTPGGGQVTLGAEQQEGQITMTVADTGMGIPAEHLPHLFERFYRTDQARSRDSGGFGLGLAISQAIMQMHGGRIEVHSVVNQGTTFTVTLPIDQGRYVT